MSNPESDTGLKFSKTLSVSIRRRPEDVYRFASNPENLPKWAPAFVRSIKQEKGKWMAQTSVGPMEIRICDQNPFGLLDHTVSPSPGAEIFVPMRVVANGEGSEVIFTLFRQPGMSEEQFQNDQSSVRRDLESLRKVMEA